MKTRTVLAALIFPCILPYISSAAEITVFEAKQYLRTTGAPIVFSDTFRGIAGQGKIIIKNGDENGNKRVSSARILVNGIEVVGPSAFKQHAATIVAPLSMAQSNYVSVSLAGMPGSYLTVQVVSEVTPDATSTKEIGIEGGTISVQNHLGDMMTVDIPPLALGEPTSISVSSMPAPLPGPIAKSVYPGVILEPAGLRFSLPVKIEVTFPQALERPESTMLFWRQDSNHAVPIAKQVVTANSIKGEIYHFSEEDAEEPSAEEAAAIAELISISEPGSPADILSSVNGLLMFAQMAENTANPQAAAEARDAAKQVLMEGSVALLSKPEPSNPCGLYTVDLQGLGTLAKTLLGDDSLAEQVTAKGCTLSITPQSLQLRQGESQAPAFHVTLLAPTGDQRSCSALQWYSDKKSVVIATANSSDSGDIAAISPGEATVSADCDKLIGSASVTVTPRNLAFSGPVSLSGLLFVRGGDCVYRDSFDLSVSGTIQGDTGTVFFSGAQHDILISGSDNCARSTSAFVGWGNSIHLVDNHFSTGLCLGGNGICLDATLSSSALAGVLTRIYSDPFYYSYYSQLVAWPVTEVTTP